MNVGARIKQARTAAGLRQVELAERLEVEQSTISRWENGSNDPSVRDLMRVASATDRDLAYFFTEDAA